MNLSNVKNLQISYNTDSFDFFHILKENQYELVDSYKTTIDILKILYEDIKTLNDYRSDLQDVFKKLQILSAEFITKEEIDNKYSRKEDFQNDKKLILSEDEMESAIDRYTNKDKIETKKNICRKEAHVAASTMTSAVLKAVNKIDRTKLLLGTMTETMRIVSEEE